MSELTPLEKQNKIIEEVCKELATFLVGKNTSYDGSVFKEIVYSGQVIDPDQTLTVRIVDKIKRLQSSDSGFNGEDSELDLCGYLILRLALKKYNLIVQPKDVSGIKILFGKNQTIEFNDGLD